MSGDAGHADELAEVLRVASLSRESLTAERAFAIAGSSRSGQIVPSYAGLIHGLLQGPKQPEHIS
jgi:hypothetical protein